MHFKEKFNFYQQLCVWLWIIFNGLRENYNNYNFISNKKDFVFSQLYIQYHNVKLMVDNSLQKVFLIIQLESQQNYEKSQNAVKPLKRHLKQSAQQNKGLKSNSILLQQCTCLRKIYKQLLSFFIIKFFSFCLL